MNFLSKVTVDDINVNGKKVLVDVKGILNRKEWTRDDCLYWRL